MRTKQDNVMRCPHCRHVGKCVWCGYGNKHSVVCERCQRRIRWEEVETTWLLDDDDPWILSAMQVSGAYH